MFTVNKEKLGVMCLVQCILTFVVFDIIKNSYLTGLKANSLHDLLYYF